MRNAKGLLEKFSKLSIGTKKVISEGNSVYANLFSVMVGPKNDRTGDKTVTVVFKNGSFMDKWKEDEIGSGTDDVLKYIEKSYHLPLSRSEESEIVSNLDRLAGKNEEENDSTDDLESAIDDVEDMDDEYTFSEDAIADRRGLRLVFEDLGKYHKLFIYKLKLAGKIMKRMGVGVEIDDKYIDTISEQLEDVLSHVEMAMNDGKVTEGMHYHTRIRQLEAAIHPKKVKLAVRESKSMLEAIMDDKHPSANPCSEDDMKILKDAQSKMESIIEGLQKVRVAKRKRKNEDDEETFDDEQDAAADELPDASEGLALAKRLTTFVESLGPISELAGDGLDALRKKIDKAEELADKLYTKYYDYRQEGKKVMAKKKGVRRTKEQLAKDKAERLKFRAQSDKMHDAYTKAQQYVSDFKAQLKAAKEKAAK